MGFELLFRALLALELVSGYKLVLWRKFKMAAGQKFSITELD
jgi:hypothetical protein